MFQITAVVGVVIVKDEALVVVVVLGERNNVHKTRTIFTATTLTRLVWCHWKCTWVC